MLFYGISNAIEIITCASDSIMQNHYIIYYQIHVNLI